VIKSRRAIWLVHASSHGIVEMYAAFMHMCGNPASRSPVRTASVVVSGCDTGCASAINILEAVIL
jgi:hypothetical protein